MLIFRGVLKHYQLHQFEFTKPLLPHELVRQVLVATVAVPVVPGNVPPALPGRSLGRRVQPPATEVPAPLGAKVWPQGAQGANASAKVLQISGPAAVMSLGIFTIHFWGIYPYFWENAKNISHFCWNIFWDSRKRKTHRRRTVLLARKPVRCKSSFTLLTWRVKAWSLVQSHNHPPLIKTYLFSTRQVVLGAHESLFSKENICFLDPFLKINEYTG